MVTRQIPDQGNRRYVTYTITKVPLNDFFLNATPRSAVSFLLLCVIFSGKQVLLKLTWTSPAEGEV